MDLIFRHKVRYALLNNYKGICQYCGNNVDSEWHIDHIIPKSKGGKDKIANFTLSCPSCNMSKQDDFDIKRVKPILMNAIKSRDFINTAIEQIKPPDMTQNGKLVQLRLPPELHTKIKVTAAADGRSLANWIARVCERAIKESEGKNEK